MSLHPVLTCGAAIPNNSVVPRPHSIMHQGGFRGFYGPFMASSTQLRSLFPVACCLLPIAYCL
ncbi:MAG: hypothetical protein J5J06_03420, partial [Phycisphaerae bacterium]|nr:hypothetical protein [Phycisphaerae bacterium]